MVGALQPDEVGRRRRAVLAGRHGDEGTVRGLLTDPDPGTRAAALGALARLGQLTPDDLEGAVTDPAPAVRRRAAEVVATTDVEVSLLRLLDDADPTVVEMAAWACGERGRAQPGTIAALADLTTGHADALVREAAVAALGAIGDPSGLPAVLAALGDRATVRRRAVLALAPFDGPEVDAALQRATTDRDTQVRHAAEDLLAEPAAGWGESEGGGSSPPPSD